MATSSDLLKKYSIDRITDISYDACDDIDSSLMNNTDMNKLYTYHRQRCVGSTALYPQTNWQAHRLMLMSSIAAKLKDQIKIRDCDRLIRQWIVVSSCKCCAANSQDYHWRDSVTYIVYGVQALVKGCLYLQKVNTALRYKSVIEPYIDFINLYETGKVKHIEFVKSKNMPSDLTKSLYNKPYPIGYAKNLYTAYATLL